MRYNNGAGGYSREQRLGVCDSCKLGDASPVNLVGVQILRRGVKVCRMATSTIPKQSS